MVVVVIGVGWRGGGVEGWCFWDLGLGRLCGGVEGRGEGVEGG